MSDTKEKKERKTTPVSEAMWCHLRTAKPGYVNPKSGKKEGQDMYQLELAVDPASKDWKEFFADIEARSTKEGYTNRPWREEFRDEQPTGRMLIKFSTYAKDQEGLDRPAPRIYNADGVCEDLLPKEETDFLIGNGTKVRVNYTESDYPGMGGGFKFYLNEVQIVELVEYVPEAPSASKLGFAENKEAVAAARAAKAERAENPF